MKFVGRDEVINHLWDALDEGSLLLTGQRRMGKSQTLKQMRDAPRKGWRVVYASIESAETVEGAIAQFEEGLQKARLRPDLSDKHLKKLEKISVMGVSVQLKLDGVTGWSLFEKLLLQAVSCLSEEERLAVFLDEVPWWLDAVRRTEGDEAARLGLAKLRYLRETYGDRVRFILTGSMGLAGLVRELDASAEVDIPIFDMPPMTRADATTLIETELAGRGKRATREGVDLIRTVTGGSPHWMKQVVAKITGDVAGEAEAKAAVERFLSHRNRHVFDHEARTHLNRRHGERAQALRTILGHIATAEQPVPLETLRSTAMQEMGAPNRREAEEMVYLLVDEYYLAGVDGGFAFANPLLALWWRKYGGSS